MRSPSIDRIDKEYGRLLVFDFRYSCGRAMTTSGQFRLDRADDSATLVRSDCCSVGNFVYLQERSARVSRVLTRPLRVCGLELVARSGWQTKLGTDCVLTSYWINATIPSYFRISETRLAEIKLCLQKQDQFRKQIVEELPRAGANLGPYNLLKYIHLQRPQQTYYGMAPSADCLGHFGSSDSARLQAHVTGAPASGHLRSSCVATYSP